MGPHHCYSGMPLPESRSVDLVDLAILLPPSSRTVLLPMFSGKARLPGEALEVGTFMTTLRDKEPRLASALQSRPDRTIICFPCVAERDDDWEAENHRTWCHTLIASMVLKLANMEHTYLYIIQPSCHLTAYQHSFSIREDAIYETTSGVTAPTEYVRHRDLAEQSAVRILLPSLVQHHAQLSLRGL